MQTADAFLRSVRQKDFNSLPAAQQGASKQPQLRFSVNGFDPTPQEAGRVSGCLQLSLLPLSGYIMTLSLWKLWGRLCPVFSQIVKTSMHTQVRK